MKEIEFQLKSLRKKLREEAVEVTEIEDSAEVEIEMIVVASEEEEVVLVTETEMEEDLDQEMVVIETVIEGVLADQEVEIRTVEIIK
jgi:hypothetical protein